MLWHMTMGAAKTPAIVALNTRGVKGATKGFAVSFRAWPRILIPIFMLIMPCMHE